MNGIQLFTSIYGSYDLIGPQTSSSLMVYQARKGLLDNPRIEESYPHCFGGINVWGVDDPLHVIPPLISLFPKLSNIIREFTNWDGACLELARLHVNGNFKHRGVWHKDSEDYESVVAIIYLMDEEGFRVCNEEGKEHTVKAKVGDVLVMRSNLLHRGHINKPRMHLHLRFVPGPDYNWDRWSRWRAKPQIHPRASTLQQWKNLANYLIGRQRSNLWQGP